MHEALTEPALEVVCGPMFAGKTTELIRRANALRALGLAVQVIRPANMGPQTTCAGCGQPSTHTQRLVAGGERIVVGGAGAYEPRCAACFRPPGRG